MRISALLLLLILAACSSTNSLSSNNAASAPASSSTQGSSAANPIPAGEPAKPAPLLQANAVPIHWKAILIAGDNSIPNFDRAVDSLDHLLLQRGITERISLSATETEWAKGKGAAVPQQIEQAFQQLGLRQGDGCLLFMTSHGNPSGFYLAQMRENRGTWTHRQFADLFNQYCGSLPSIAIISACYSGGFIDDDTVRPNRIILTAARRDRTSFGCGTETEYTYYDDCLLRNWTQSRTWSGLAANIGHCVDEKERRTDAQPSQPQYVMGEQMQGLLLP